MSDVPIWVPNTFVKFWSKALKLNQCTIPCGIHSASQCWRTISKLSSRCSHESSLWCTSRSSSTCWCICQCTLTALIHSPEGGPTSVANKSTSEREGTTRTGGRSFSKLSSNITWKKWIFIKCLTHLVWKATCDFKCEVDVDVLLILISC